jgi:hypothetical protein
LIRAVEEVPESTVLVIVLGSIIVDEEGVGAAVLGRLRWLR